MEKWGLVDFYLNEMVHGEEWVGKWRGNRRREWVFVKCHVGAEHSLVWALHTLAATIQLTYHS